MTQETINKTQIDFIPGMPPEQPFDSTIGDRTNTVVRNSMPMVRIYPGIPTFTKGASLFTRKDFFEGSQENYLSYSSLLSDHGFTLSQNFHKKYLTLAYLADSFPTDSFTNEYGENFLQGLTDVSSSAAASISQMFGARTLGEAMGKITGAAKAKGGLFEDAAGMVEKGGTAVGDFLSSLPIAGGTNIVSALASGSRLDFPMVWKSSGFQPSYTMTIRLYNPNPGNRETTNKYIAGPIAAIMLLGMPISADKSGATYSWPFIHRIWSPGIYDLDPAYISNITVIKGGDQQQIGYGQRLGIVDVRIDFGSLYSSILASRLNQRTRPTLKRYIEGISGANANKDGIQNFSTVGSNEDEVISYQKKQNEALASNPSAVTKNNILNTVANMGKSALNEAAKALKGQALDSINNQRLPSLDSIKSATVNAGIRGAKSQAPTVEELTSEEVNNPNDRVSSTATSIANNLIARIPSGIKI